MDVTERCVYRTTFVYVTLLVVMMSMAWIVPLFHPINVTVQAPKMPRLR